MREIEIKLCAGMKANGFPERTQDQIVRFISSFALCGFPESHAASFALIAYASAFLKVRCDGDDCDRQFEYLPIEGERSSRERLSS